MDWFLYGRNLRHESFKLENSRCNELLFAVLILYDIVTYNTCLWSFLPVSLFTHCDHAAKPIYLENFQNKTYFQGKKLYLIFSRIKYSLETNNNQHNTKKISQRSYPLHCFIRKCKKNIYILPQKQVSTKIPLCTHLNSTDSPIIHYSRSYGKWNALERLHAKW